MRFFRRRYMCILCSSYRDESYAMHRHMGLCICKDCYNKIKTGGDNTYQAKEPLEAVISPFAYDGRLKTAIKRYKFASQRAYGTVMGKMLSAEVLSHPYFAGYDLVIPVPLHGKRLNSRGYNQTEIIAEVFATKLGIPYIADALFRIKETKQQSSLRGIDRIENVKSAFYAYDKIVRDKNIILVDDVCTRGETISSCAKALVDAGANKVVGVTLSKTQYKERVFLR